MNLPVVYGAPYSVYVRIVRMALEEKSVEYILHDVDIFSVNKSPENITDRHPFHRIPTFEHDKFELYETSAITRFIDEQFPNPPLIPPDIKCRARMNQIISILDNYAYRAWVWGLFVELVSNSEDNLPTNMKIVKTAIDESRKSLQAISDLRTNVSPYLAGSFFTLADIYAIPMYAYLIMTDIGREMTECYKWHQWWELVKSRDSVTKTRFPRE